MNIVLCGFGRAGKECLEKIVSAEDVPVKDVLVYTHDHAQNTEFIDYLKKAGFSYSVESINKDKDRVGTFAPECLVSAYYRNIVSNDVLKLVGGKAMNLHPSLLPDYRGCYSGMWAILNGESATGITFHYMTDEVDGGNIILQRKIAIAGDDTAYSLYHKAVSAFVENFSDAFGRLRSGDPGSAQPKGGLMRYYSRQLPFGGAVDIKTVTYEQARRIVRAFYYPPYRPVEFIIDGRRVEVGDETQLAAYRKYFMVAS
jgi:methionyl-tRNA formyltransferase